jgi:hypothetical protein
MERVEKIAKIKEIIETYGSFTIADIEADSSPCVGSLGRNCIQLLESFDINSVEAVVYVDDRENDSEDILYEDLKDDNIDEVLELAKKWETICFDELNEF